MGAIPGFLGVFLVVVACNSEPAGLYQQANIPGNVNNNQQGNGALTGALNRQGGGLSFAIPGLSLLAGNNAGLGGLGGAGNFFGTVTVTRTIVSTVSTVTTASFRTCLAPTAGVMPCAVGRRRRRGASATNIAYAYIQPTPSMSLIVGGTTLTEPQLVTSYLLGHQLSSQSVIYPPGVQPWESHHRRSRTRSVEAKEFSTTVLYPSQDTPDEDAEDDTISFSANDDVFVTTQTPQLLRDIDSIEGGIPTTDSPQKNSDFGGEKDDDVDDKARVGFGRTTTVTSIIRVTSVATTLASGAMATLTIMYAGCLPQSLPVSALPC